MSDYEKATILEAFEKKLEQAIFLWRKAKKDKRGAAEIYTQLHSVSEAASMVLKLNAQQ